MIDGHPRSTATIAGHPIHPMLIPFPIVFFVSTFVCDLVYLSNGNADWAQATVWLLGAGLVTAAAAAIAGLVDFAGDSRISSLSDARQHMIANVIAVVLEAVNFFLRYDDAPEAILPFGVILSAVVAAILLFSGWKGGELVFRHGVGMGD